MTTVVDKLQVRLMVGATTLSPASRDLMEAVRRFRVQEDEDGPTLFSISFDAPQDIQNSMYRPVAHDPNLQPFKRIAITATLNNASAQVLVDGFITHVEYTPGDTGHPGAYTVIGEDVSVMMSLANPTAEHVNLGLSDIANTIIKKYGQYQISPKVVAPTAEDPKITRLQTVNDRQYLQYLATMCGYVFYIDPGPSLGRNTAYWGPRITTGTTQQPLDTDAGPETNITELKFEYRALDPYLVNGQVLDISGNKAKVVPLKTTASSDTALSGQPSISALGKNVRSGIVEHAGMSVASATLVAQGKTTNSAANAVIATGKLSVFRYGNILRARKLAAVRGSGKSYDGTYRVKKVLHEFGRGIYDQTFTLAREGLESKSTKVTT